MDTTALRPALDHLSPAVAASLRSMPKTELHLHLDGSLLVETALDLARSRHIEAPRTIEAMRLALIAPERCGSQAELLRAFDLPIALLQDADALARAAADLVRVKAHDGVRYLEIRWGPLLHVRGGLPLEEGIAAVVEGGMAEAERRQSTVRFICTALRNHDPTDNVGLAEAASRFVDRGLVAFDLAGPEEAFPDPLLHVAAFDAARAGGLRITIHAGEWGGADQLRRSLALAPERIAHGTGAVADRRLIDELIDRRIALDICPTSNVQAGIVSSVADHPLATLHRAGLAVTLSTDDLTVSNLTLSEEYARALREIGLTLAELWAIDRRSLDVAFAGEADLAPLRVAFDDWAAERPGFA
ncbi:MAG TPA: adenosine deaminase [Candidatus Limnocylindrales bacterium]|nr:adenosine deaminase [Candidatus Limnocylindrales bacterium]